MDDSAIQDAKAYLLQSSTVTGLNVYDHLAGVISKLLERLYSEGLLSRSKLRGVWHYLHRG